MRQELINKFTTLALICGTSALVIVFLDGTRLRDLEDKQQEQKKFNSLVLNTLYTNNLLWINGRQYTLTITNACTNNVIVTLPNNEESELNWTWVTNGNFRYQVAIPTNSSPLSIEKEPSHP